MKIKWQYKIEDKNSTQSFEYNGLYAKLKNGIAFLYAEQEQGDCIRQLDLSDKGELLQTLDYPVFDDKFDIVSVENDFFDIKSFSSIKDIDDCFLFSDNEQEFLYVGSDKLYICPETHTIITSTPLPFLKTNPEESRPSHHHEKDHFIFENYVISHKSPFVYQCTSNTTGQLLWEKKVIGYLYTNFIRYGEGVLFGTAEKGGKLYYIDLENGTSILEIETGGTQNFILQKEFCYCHRIGNKAMLLKINLKNGNIEEFPLSGKSSIDCPIRFIDDTIYTLTFEHLNDGKNANPTIWAIEETL